ncbi:MAG TPA: carboxypeptidase regulatory-like domain-containing protein [Pyrinomonadaceae bacterium]|jgi:hypothetical protein
MRQHAEFARRLVILALVFCAGLCAARAQETTGTINGTVTDSTGAAVKGATVTLTDQEKKVVVRTVTTGDEGEYSVPNLPVAVYTITVEAANFKKSVQTNIKLDVNARRSVDVTVEAGNISEVVTVEADPVTVELTSPQSSTLISGDQVRELSINNRNFVQLVTLAPGVTNDLDDLVFTGTNNPETQVVNRTLISVNGARSTQNTFTVDGADVTDRGTNLTIQAYPSVDSIGEFKVLRSLYPAESGRSGGGQINVVTRSGGDEFHGSAFEFIRNEAFNANDFQTNRTPALRASLGVDDNGKIKRRPFRYNNYGFTVGGPVYFFNFGEGSNGVGRKLARTFFFFSEEQRRDTRYPTISTTAASTAAPNALMKQGVFPVDVCLRATSSTTCADVLPAGTPLSSRVPVSNVAQQYVNRIWNNVPNPTNPATLALDFPALNVAKFRQEIVKIDHTFTNSLSAFYRFENDKIPTLDADGSIGTRSNLPFVNRMESNSPGKTHTAQATYAVNPNMIFEGRYAYGWGAIFTKTLGLLAKDVSPIGVNLPYESVRDVVPIVSIAGFASLTGFSNYDNFSWKQNFSSSLTWIRGGHTMKYGGIFSLYRKNENALSGTNQGSFSAFNNTIPSITGASVRAPGVANTAVNNLYQSWANFLQGNNVTFTQSKLDLTADLRQKNLEWFAQDEWRARRNLTISYGVRYSYFGPAYDRNGQLSNFVPSLWDPSQAPQVTGAGNRVVGTGNFCNGLVINAQNYTKGPAAFNCTPLASPWGKYVYQASKHDFAPRIGVAWDPFGKGTTSIRTGYGIYHEQIPVSTVELLANNPPYQETTTVLNTTLDQPIPAGQPISVVAPLTPQSITRSIQADLDTPYMQQWSLDVQHQFGSKTVMTVGYYGSKGTHLIGFTEYNDLPLGKAITTQCATGANTLQTPGAATVLCMTPGTALTATPAIFDQIRPFRGYRSLNILESRYNSNYHSLQFSAQHRFTGASQVNVAYTWSKNLTDNQSSSVNAAPQDINNIRAEYGRALLDRRHVLNVNYIYELPFYSKQEGFAGKVLGGWQLSGIASYYTGLPFTVSYATYDPSGIGYIPAAVAGGRPSLTCDPNENAPHTIDQWFNAGCFTPQTAAGATGIANVAGNAPRGAVDGPPTTRFDLTLTKNVRFGENVRVQLRAEAFNALNHTNFRGLSTSRALTNTTFGQVTSFRDPRVMQFGAKFYF